MTGLKPTERRAARPVTPLIIGVLAVLGTAATYRVFVGTITGQWVDTAAMLGGDVQDPRVVRVLSQVLYGTSLGGLVLVCVVAAAVGVLRRQFGLAAAAAVLVVGANGTTQVLKGWLPRPELDGLAFANSFPSGHTTAAASVVFALVLVLPEAVRGVVALIGAGYTGVIATATVWARWHRPSDTIAAVLVVLGWGALVVLVVRVLRRAERTPVNRLGRFTVLPLVAAGTIAAPAGLLGMTVLAMSEPQGTPTPGRFAFLAGVAVIVAAVAGVFLLWPWLASDVLPPSRPGPRRGESVPQTAGV
ncbi:MULTISPECIES: phosphatase PAP2 family protein [Actinoplanes]|uniref:phosphatase PAP2 family protein n=1 Tax=Actinoplanes TaxID=1865 RepID=UPI0005F2B09E|nr:MULTISPECIES: phosphatase PAP2 family protein [Actinoplanes]GLY06563.1 hypothetical protein Acsp01_69420 [Actinoplanes sp. NBRC 101535]